MKAGTAAPLHATLTPAPGPLKYLHTTTQRTCIDSACCVARRSRSACALAPSFSSFSSCFWAAPACTPFLVASSSQLLMSCRACRGECVGGMG